MLNKITQLLQVCLEKNVPFVSYSLPESNEIHTWVQSSGQFNYVEHFYEIADKEGFVYAPFHRRTNFPIAFFEPEDIFVNDEIDLQFIEKLANRDKMYPDDKLEIPISIRKEEYLLQTAKFVSSLNDQFTKAVLSRVERILKPAGFDPGEFFLHLKKSYPKAFCHIIYLPGAGLWTGASPETLVRMDGKQAWTLSLAGTQPKPKDDKTIKWSEKEIAEQRIVTDYIEEILRGFRLHSFEKEKTYDLTAGNAVHLATKFKFDQQLIKDHFAGFVTQLHPTPAVCGFPKEKALDLIFETEEHNREYYSGYCGPLNYKNNTDLFVNLRCMKILNDEMALFVGGGLTKLSAPEKEWEETVLKAKTLLSII
ncbi:MAG: chorismate-binding protein [Bacteroidales bacterium]|nr:chorismate-binding protein [Bacteroidales bacterium]MCF8402596.1 chorismate-binding protein [Bacteroidales bacterium]